MAQSPQERVAVALVRGLHGLRGAVRVEVLSDVPGRFALGTLLYLEGGDQPLTVAWTGPTKRGLLVRFAEFTSREAADSLRDRYLEVLPEAPLPEGSWYWHEIEGLEVRTTDGQVLGTVSQVFRAGAGEVYVVSGGRRGEVLVPAVRSVVLSLAPAEGHMVVDPAALDLPPEMPEAPDEAPEEIAAAPEEIAAAPEEIAAAPEEIAAAPEELPEELPDEHPDAFAEHTDASAEHTDASAESAEVPGS